MQYLRGYMWDYGWCDCQDGVVTFITLCWQLLGGLEQNRPGVCFDVVNNPVSFDGAQRLKKGPASNYYSV